MYSKSNGSMFCFALESDLYVSFLYFVSDCMLTLIMTSPVMINIMRMATDRKLVAAIFLLLLPLLLAFNAVDTTDAALLERWFYAAGCDNNDEL